MADRLFKPLKLGNVQLKHRITMAPLTRFRGTSEHIPGPHAKEYYKQRASVPGTFIITEATFISPAAGGYANIPGIWNDTQVEAWKEIVDAVHAKGSFIFLQLWALGRVTGADPTYLKSTGYPVVGPSAIAVNSKYATPQELSEDEVQGFIKAYADGARNAIKAGFDGVEIHGANGYLIDQFWQDVSNQRNDTWGGSIENRARFGLEVTKACIAAVGGDANKVGMRLSPWSDGQGMGMSDALPQFSYIVSELKKLGLAYLHLIEARIGGKTAVDAVYPDITRENDKLVELWGTEAPVMLAGGYTPEKARKIVGEIYTQDNVTVSFGRYFISTPDLPYRVQHGIELNPYNRATFYKPNTEEGYTDYPFSKEFLGVESRL